MRVLAISQARLNSTRLPNKVLQKVGDSTILGLHINRILKSCMISEYIVATTTNREDDEIISVCDTHGAGSFRGSEYDVLDRYYKASLVHQPDFIVRLTADNPLIDPWLIDATIKKALALNLDYISNSLEPSFPNGVEVEVFKFSALEKAWKESTLPSEREHVTPYIWKNCSFFEKSTFSSANISAPGCFKEVRITVDEEADLRVIRRLVEDLGTEKGWLDYARHYMKNEKVHELNSHISRNMGYKRSLEEEDFQSILRLKTAYR